MRHRSGMGCRGMKSAVTICLVPEARQGPFVFHDGLEAGCRMAAELGFDAVEVFPESAEGLPVADLRRLLATHGLRLAAVGTGAGWVKHGLHLCHPDAAVRTRARDFIAALESIGYRGHLSAEIFPLPTPRAAAEQTITSFQTFTKPTPPSLSGD